jgi:hypothetical protein
MGIDKSRMTQDAAYVIDLDRRSMLVLLDDTVNEVLAENFDLSMREVIMRVRKLDEEGLEEMVTSGSITRDECETAMRPTDEDIRSSIANYRAMFNLISRNF